MLRTRLFQAFALLIVLFGVVAGRSLAGASRAMMAATPCAPPHNHRDHALPEPAPGSR